MTEDRLPYGISPPAYRLPETTHVGAVHLQVSDLQQSLSYYEQVLGLASRHITSESAILSADAADKPLVMLHTRSGIIPAGRGAFGLFHFAILLPDRAALGRFAAHLTSFDLKVGMADHLVSEAIYLWDPDGLGIEVYADRPRNTWRHHDRELAMTTDPLDIERVIAAGGGEQWTGAPRGTTMGHVHLHVGSLAEAEAFYHRALGLDKTVWNYPERCSCLPVAITIISAPTSGRKDLHRLIIKLSCSNGSCSCRRWETLRRSGKVSMAPVIEDSTRRRR